MKKSKLLPKDGSQFTVFFLKENNADIVVSNDLNEMDVNENSAWAEKFQPFGILPPTPQLLPSPPYCPLIDDSISSDHVGNPVAGRIYKIKDLNVLGRFEGSTVRSPEWINHDSEVVSAFFHLSVHGTSVYVNQHDDLLLKASRREVEIYLNIEQ